MKAHCDNCDDLIVDAMTTKRVTVQPLGYQCFVEVQVRKQSGSLSQQLCRRCLLSAAEEFAATLRDSRDEPPAAPLVDVTP